MLTARNFAAARELVGVMPRTIRIPSLFACALTLLAIVGTSGAAASSTQQTIIEDDAQLVANPAQTTALMHGLGASRVRVFVAWSSVAPDPNSARAPHFNAANPAAYSSAGWSTLDAKVRALAAGHMGVYLTITGPAPRWAEGRGAPRATGGRYVWEPNDSDFAAFVKAIGTRYSGHYTPAGASGPLPRVSFWSIWNEPNYGYDLAPQSSGANAQRSAALYRGLLGAGYAALRASGHGSDTILFGETAPHGSANGGRFGGVAPLRFLRALYCVGGSFRPLLGGAARANGCPSTPAASRRFRASHPALFDAGGMAAHLYAQGTPPNRSLNDRCARGQDRADYADLASVGKLERTLDRAQAAYGSHRHLEIYNTEFGYQTSPPQRASCAANSLPVSLTTAAYYMNWAEYISYRNARIASYDQYLLVDAARGNFDSGLEFSNGKPKQAVFDAFMLPLYLPRTSVRGPATLQVWGGVRPAPFAGADAQLQFQPGSRGAWQTIATISKVNRSGYFDLHERFAHSGSVRVQWRNPLLGNTYDSRTVKVAVG
jgi:hypothetical protein